MYEIILDIETTGLSKFNNFPIQFAWQVLNFKRDTVEKGSFYIRSRPFLSPKITKITGITQELLNEKGCSNLVATGRYMSLIRKWQPCTLIGHNLISFDFPILHNWMELFFEGHFKQPPIAGLIDTMHLASAKFKTKKWLRLEECAKRLGISFSKGDLHNATEDVRITKAVYLKLLD